MQKNPNPVKVLVKTQSPLSNFHRVGWLERKTDVSLSCLVGLSQGLCICLHPVAIYLWKFG